MGGIFTLTNGFLDAVNAVNSAWDKQTQNEAEFETSIKQIRLQNDINGELLRMRQSGNFNQWNDNISDFFERIKSGMSNPDSPYYCKNQIQADYFNKILAENNTRMSYQVAQMSQKYQIEKMQVEADNAKQILRDSGIVGDQYIEEADAIDNQLYDAAGSSIGPMEQNNRKKANQLVGYEDTINRLFNDSLEDALEKGESFGQFFGRVLNEARKLNNSTSYLNRDEINSRMQKEKQALWNARMVDIQKRNAGDLSEILGQIRAAKTDTDKLKLAEYGLRIMNNDMLGDRLTDNDRDHYSRSFEAYINNGDQGNKSSGSGSSSDSLESFVKFINEAPEEAVYRVKNGDVNNYYEATRAMSYVLTQEWLNENFKENKNMDSKKREEYFRRHYQSKVAPESLEQLVVNELKTKYSVISDLIDKKYKNLKDDMKNNPEKYGGASVSDLGDFLIDTMLGSNANETEDQILDTFNKYINNCYVEKCKYVELNKKGKLEDKFDVNKTEDIVKAANLVRENDYVFTYSGQERWAKGKKEALEADGGIINVLQSAVKNVLGIPGNEKVNFKYKNDEMHDDKTSTPIFLYKGKEYEVIPTEDGKAFNVWETTPGVRTIEKNNKVYEVFKDENGNDYMQEAKSYESKATKDIKKENKEIRKAEKQEAKAIQKQQTEERMTIEEERDKQINNRIMSSTELPKAVKAAGSVKESEWRGSDSLTTRKILLQDTENVIDNDAVKVKKKKMTEEEFFNKYGITYSDWTSKKEISERFNLMLAQ